MKFLAPILTLSALLAPAAAQWDHLEKILNPKNLNKDNLPPKADVSHLNPDLVHEIGNHNWRLLQDSDVDWLVLMTIGTENCPGCGKFENNFNSAVKLLEDRKDIYFGKVDCDKEQVLCSLFSTWGSRLWHITHSEADNPHFPGIIMHKTHLRHVSFHPTGAPPAYESPEEAGVDKDGKPNKPLPKLDPTWIEKVIRENLWAEFEEWKGASQPFEGWAHGILVRWWWVVSWFTKVPPYVTMIVIALGSRYVTSRFAAKTMHVPRREGTGGPAADAAIAAAKKKSK